MEWMSVTQDAYFIGGKMPARLTLNGYSSGMSGCFGVFDGHGGDRASRYCAEHLFPKIQEEIEANTESKIEAAITTAVHAIGTNERFAVAPSSSKSYGRLTRVSLLPI